MVDQGPSDTKIETLPDSAQNYFGSRDFSHLKLKENHQNRPLWIDPIKRTIILEQFHPYAKQATEFLITIAEPSSRPAFIHEYCLTANSLYAAVSVGLDTDDIIQYLDQFLKVDIPDTIRSFIRSCTENCGKVKLVLKANRYYMESVDRVLLDELFNDEIIVKLGIGSPFLNVNSTLSNSTDDNVQVASGGLPALSQGTEQATSTRVALFDLLTGNDDDDDGEHRAAYAYEIPDEAVEALQKRCLDFGFPLLEEYDFRRDSANPDLDIDLRPQTLIRPYQETGLGKMFGNGRARSGIIVLPCGAGKTLVGITAACTIKKGTIVLCTSSVSAVQWRQEFLKWSNIKPEDITLFTADSKSTFAGDTGIIVSTYAMMANGQGRSHDSQQMMDFLKDREWGLMILDEVHVVPANMFRRVTSSIKSHSKLGLTATLVREDDKISHLNFLIGPKLFEANWNELSQQGHIAKVQCAEVWCAMPSDFLEQYQQAPSHTKRTLSTINPEKFQACQYLIEKHEARGDKIIVFSDDLYSLRQYALKLNKAFICGETGQEERLRVLENFQKNPLVNTLFLSKVGDTSLDLPEATCLIQISSHYGSRRQEAQRLGRILRAKRRNEEGFNAFFYSLVSKNTQEMVYSARRQAFLVDQGYSFKVSTRLAGLSSMPNLAFSSAEERGQLLKEVMAHSKISTSEQTEAAVGTRISGKPADKRKRKQNPFFQKIAREEKRRGRQE
ncbi:Putative TFIIH complex helicase Ssl2 [[Torrubiella] hemipterigena]|uniref:DNA 3'-5' helicase n=1 Tax=[Torrubiella] hemipterigena TaxID=1531966 RepID=A0A0A1SYR3_9HYPO|nr:Putative TFIIH complex helicase Ssl2 [[Torrubiella] hemipterigena]